jgi:hypothetical protein
MESTGGSRHTGFYVNAQSIKCKARQGSTYTILPADRGGRTKPMIPFIFQGTKMHRLIKSGISVLAISIRSRILM